MEKNIIKKVAFIVLAVLISIGLFSRVAFADTAPIDINSLETIGEATPSSSTQTPTSTNETPTTGNTVSGATNNTIVNTRELPHTGSNTEIIFFVGLTILVGTTIYIYKKVKVF